MLLQKEKLLCVIAAAIFLMASLLSAEAQQVEVMNSSSAASTLELNIHRADFPVDFFIGVGTSAAQKEGAAEEEGRSPSVWDHRAKTLPGAIRQSDKFPKAIDGYRRYMLLESRSRRQQGAPEQRVLSASKKKKEDEGF